MGITIRNCNTTFDGKDIVIYTLENQVGMKAEICNLGAVVMSLLVPDRNGRLDDVVLGFEKIESYYQNKPYLGATIGRHANRIEGAYFEIDGIRYELARNDGTNHIHGGNKGFDKVVWNKDIINDEEISLSLSYISKDMEENYPGSLEIKVTYTLTSDNSLKIDYYAVSDSDTIVNLTNHSYFNLSGHDSGDVLGHELMVDAEYFTVINDKCLPTGEVCHVSGTALDFRISKIIFEGLKSQEQQILNGKGYDHNFVLNSRGDLNRKAADLYDPISGRRMEVYTTKPGVQFYSGNYLEGIDVGKGGAVYKKWSGLCLETQFFPNAMKHKHFPSPILKKGQEYRHTTIYKFV